MDTNTFNTTALQDELTGALVGLARAADTAPAVSDATWQVMIEALAANSPAAACNEAEILSLIDRVHAEKFKVVPDCAICASPCGRTADYNMANIWNAPENVRSLKVLILLGVHGLAGYAHRALALGVPDDELNRFFAEALATIGEELSPEYLQPTLLKTGEMVCKCKVLLDKASAETSSTPLPRRASTTYAVTVHRINKLRPVYAEVPPRVEYTLPDLGYSLKPVLDTIWAWGEGHQAKMRG